MVVGMLMTKSIENDSHGLLDTRSRIYLLEFQFTSFNMLQRERFNINFATICTSLGKKIHLQLTIIFSMPKCHEILEWCALCDNCNVPSP